MSSPMTPTEQDKELEAQLDKIFPCDCGFIKGFAFRLGDPCDGSCVNAPYREAVLQLITADRKLVALEARIETVMYIDAMLRSENIPLHPVQAESLKQYIRQLEAQQEANQ